jgi:hypothetical protein
VWRAFREKRACVSVRCGVVLNRPADSPGMAHQSLYQDDDAAQPRRGRLGRAIRRLAGVSPRRGNGTQNGAQDGTQHGESNGRQEGYQNGAHEGARNGAQNGSANGVHHGFTEGASDDPSDGQQHGTRHGQQQRRSNGASHGSEIERALGLEFHIVDGLVLAYQPGHVPAPGAKEHAKGFLWWLQSQEHFPGNEVPARLLEDALYPLFCSVFGCDPYAWRTVAGHFRRLPGVKRRQYDGRTGGDRAGSMPTVYKIPRRKS